MLGSGWGCPIPAFLRRADPNTVLLLLSSWFGSGWGCPIPPCLRGADPKRVSWCQVLRIRRDVLKCYRGSHGQRIKLDHSGQTSIELALDIRLRWACGDWSVIMQEVASKFADKASLQAWGILRPTGWRCPTPACPRRADLDRTRFATPSTCHRVVFGRSFLSYQEIIDPCSAQPVTRGQV